MKIAALVFAVLLAFSFAKAEPLPLDKEKEASQAFLDKEAKTPKTEKTLSGLLYRETKTGKGANPKPTDEVTVEYTGTNREGKVFDSTKGRGPATFPLNAVIKCWTEALQRMKVGGKSVIVCPSEIAYGDRAMGDAIPAGAALKFEVSLLKINGK